MAAIPIPNHSHVDKIVSDPWKFPSRHSPGSDQQPGLKGDFDPLTSRPPFINLLP